MAVLEARGLAKAYGGVTALADGGISVEAGSAHALLGENGAGKSTLVKIVSGVVRPDAGTLLLDGEPVRFNGLADAQRHGVAVVSQELNLFPDLDVIANLFPLNGPRRGPFRDRRAMRRLAEPVLEQLGLDVDPGARVGDLTLGQRQLVEIARALLTQPRVLVLDEPTSALDTDGAERLLGVLQVLRERKVAVVFVSHILEEVLRLCDTITVMRDGRVVLDGADRAGLSLDDVVKEMLGDRLIREEDTPKDSISTTGDGLSLSGVTVPGVLEGVGLDARPGEIVGLTGLAGAGHLAVLEVVAGIKRPSAGSVRLPGGRAAPHGLRRAIGAGVAVVSGDRRRVGLTLDQTVWENIAQVRAVGQGREGPFFRRSGLRDRARAQVERLGIKCRDVDQPTGLLSGGNQQKVVLAKWLEAEPEVLLLDDPTRGVDVGAKAELHALIRAAAGEGAVVLLCSTDLDELVTLCHRVLVFHRGTLVGEASDQHAIVRMSNTGSAIGSDTGEEE